MADIFPDSLHVRGSGFASTDDPIIWDYAKDNDFMIVSKDVDMHDLSLVFGNPPKVVLVAFRKLLYTASRRIIAARF